MTPGEAPASRPLARPGETGPAARPPLAARPVLFLHAGLQKTGTSSLQARLLRPGGPLGRAGIDTLGPAAGPGRAHHNAAREAGGRDHRPDLPGLAALAAGARAAPLSFASSEEFGVLPDQGLERLRDALDGIEVRPVLVLRNPLDLAESLHAQACKRRPRDGFAAHLALLEYGGRLALDAVAARWERAFGRGALRLLAYEDHPDVAAAVLPLLGLPASGLPARRRNASLNERFVGASQRLMRRAEAGGLPGFAGPEGIARLARALGRIGPRHSRFAGRPVFLSRAEAAAFLLRMRPVAEALAPRLPLPPAWWAPDPDRREPEPARPEDEALLLEGLAGEAP